MTVGLTNADKKGWAPIPEVSAWLKSRLPSDAKVLDVGPGHSPLPWATEAVDFVDVPGLRVPLTKCDITSERLPFADKSFDFVYCRHLLEDSWNPFAVCAEMSRVGKAGYIEMPSPMAEIGRGVDGGSPPYRGYHHHRFIGWTFGKELRLISKYPFIEYLRFDEDQVLNMLRASPRYWNTYYLWDGEIRTNHRQAPLDYEIPTQYALVLAEAMERSKEAADIFFSQSGFSSNQRS